MLDKYFEATFTLEQLRDGAGGSWLDGFAQSLHDDGYAWWTARTYLRAAHHLGHFVEIRGIDIVAVSPDVIIEFRRHLKRCRCPKPRGRKSEDTIRGAESFLRYLRSAGIIAEYARQSVPPLVDGFRHWLSFHRGASQTTLTRYGAAAVGLIEELGDDPGRYDAKGLRAFLLARARRRGAGGTRAILSAIRMFLRYLATQGKCAAGLDAAVPAIAGWRLASLPHCLSVDEVERLVSACDLTLAMGLRDRAVILLLARLGLRASDVATLRFTDIDWHDGSILVKGKSRREARLPLPQEVGDAMLAYLEHRPLTTSDRVFLRSLAPLRALPAHSVSQIVARAMRRSGVTGQVYGSHVLRHTAATEMLHRGVSLYDIGSVLRHRSVDMSAYYAKIDMDLLKQIAQPWPEVLSC
ncbi:MAG TPA: tyrosine-type recombinase/integrase [Polyangiaceae bacterium]